MPTQSRRIPCGPYTRPNGTILTGPAWGAGVRFLASRPEEESMMRHEPQSGGSEAVGQEPRPVDFPKVLEDELEEVIERRREAGLHVPTPGDEAKAKVDRTLVGLSLSGGDPLG